MKTTRITRAQLLALGRQVPNDLARTQAGAGLVLDLLGRLEHGVYT